MLLATYYAPNYAGIIGTGLIRLTNKEAWGIVGIESQLIELGTNSC